MEAASSPNRCSSGLSASVQMAQEQRQTPVSWSCSPLRSRRERSSSGQVTPVPTERGTATRVKSIMHDIMTPILACVAPPLESCSAIPTERSWIGTAASSASRCTSPMAVPMKDVPQMYKARAAAAVANSIAPTEQDVLCGRGSNRHAGNFHFRELITANHSTYKRLTKKQKFMMSRSIVDVIHRAGGRFLSWNSQAAVWQAIDLPRALEKTSQALRECQDTDKAINDSTSFDEDTQRIRNSRSVEPPSIQIPPHLRQIYRYTATEPLRSVQTNPINLDATLSSSIRAKSSTPVLPFRPSISSPIDSASPPTYQFTFSQDQDHQSLSTSPFQLTPSGQPYVNQRVCSPPSPLSSQQSSYVSDGLSSPVSFAQQLKRRRTVSKEEDDDNSILMLETHLSLEDRVIGRRERPEDGMATALATAAFLNLDET